MFLDFVNASWSTKIKIPVPLSLRTWRSQVKTRGQETFTDTTRQQNLITGYECKGTQWILLQMYINFKMTWSLYSSENIRIKTEIVEAVWDYLSWLGAVCVHLIFELKVTFSSKI